MLESNQLHPAFKAGALPNELISSKNEVCCMCLSYMVASLGVEPSPPRVWAWWLNRLSCQRYVEGALCARTPFSLLVSIEKAWEYSFQIATSLTTLLFSRCFHLLLVSNAHACLFTTPAQGSGLARKPLTNTYSIIFPLPSLRPALGCYANIVSIQSNIWCLWHHISLIAYH